MSIGSLSALLRLSAKPVVSAMYLLSGSQVKHVVLRSLASPPKLVPAIAISLLVALGTACAGEIKDSQQQATAEKYFDWKFSQKVWFEMNTVEKFDAEWAKYAADFEPWLKAYQQDPRKAFDALDKYSKDKRKNIQRGYDMQLAIDQWWDHVYSPWFNRYAYVASRAVVHKDKAPTFDDYLASYGSRAPCFPETMLDECGPVPDWRTDAVKFRAKAMMQKADQEAAEAEARRLAKFGKRK